MFDTGIYKFLKTPYDQNNWLTKSLSFKRRMYMSSELLKLENKSLIHNEFYGFVKSAGRIDVPLFLNTFRNFCITNKCIVNQLFNYDKLVIKKGLCEV